MCLVMRVMQLVFMLKYVVTHFENKIGVEIEVTDGIECCALMAHLSFHEESHWHQSETSNVCSMT